MDKRYYYSVNYIERLDELHNYAKYTKYYRNF